MDAGEVVGLLAAAGIRLALLETATAGQVAQWLRATPGGGEVVTGAHVIADAGGLSAAFHVSPAKIEAFGWLSEMVAAEAAASLIDTYEGGWGLALLGNCSQEGDVNDAAGEMMVALGTPSATIVQRVSREAAFDVTLHLLRQEALAVVSAGRPRSP